MVGFCAAPAAAGLAAKLLADTDCQAFGLVERGYAALSAPGGAVQAALTGLLTVAIALFGYQLLLGRGLALGDAVRLAIKVGVVLLLATSWESWQSLAYDSLARAPTRVAAELTTSIGAPEPMAGLQRALDRLEGANGGWRERAGIASPLAGGPPATAAMLNISALVLTLTTVGLMVIARVVLALLLAIAPAMAGFLLFRSTRGLAEGWLRAMIGAALVPLAVLVLFAVELSILNPLLDRLATEQAGGKFEGASVTPIGLVVLIFGLAILAAVRAAATIANGLRLPRGGSGAPVIEARVIERAAPGSTAALAAPAALRLTQALETLSRREGSAPGATARTVTAALASAERRGGGTGERGTAVNGAMTAITSFVPGRPTMLRAPRRTRAAARRDV